MTKEFFGGFALAGESHYFDEFINPSCYTVGGFSYGAIKAIRKVLEMLEEGRRVDTLLLISPAFFQDRDAKFKKLQRMAFVANKALYLDNFLNSCFSPHARKAVELGECSVGELDELLEYVWSAKELALLVQSGVKIEVYLGDKDAIIDAKKAKEFFLPFATVSLVIGGSHFLDTSSYNT